MALQGTIKDFALPDIFQLIGIQKKTGILTLDGGQETVTLKFLDGQVVGADTESKGIEDRLGEVLVRTGTITEQQLSSALRSQKNTLQRLGYILVSDGAISEDELVDALRIQSSQIIYRLFRWKTGNYHFDPVEDLDYDQRHFTPMSAETILMEGARMIDEWPIIERRIKNEKMVLRKTESALALDLTDPPPLEQDEIDFDLGFGFDQSADEPEPEKADDCSLEPEEQRILNLVDGKRTVGEVCDLLAIGEFDTYRIMADLLSRNLLEEAPRIKERAAKPAPARILANVLTGAARIGLVVAAGTSLFTLPQNPVTPWELLAGEPATEQLRRYASVERLGAIEKALQVFYLDSGALPRNLATLAQHEYLAPSDLHDPWGRPYGFELREGGYRLLGHAPDGSADPGMTVSRRFNSVEIMMIEAGSSQRP